MIKTSLPKVQELRSRVRARVAEARTRVRSQGIAGQQVRLGEGVLVEQARRRADMVARRLAERKPGVIPMVKEFRPGENLRRFFPYITDNKDMTGVTAGTLTTSQRQMAEEFRRGMADALGVPPEAIREDVVQRWIVNWTRAFVKPEYWAEVAPTTDTIRELGRELGEIVRSTLHARERLGLMRQAQPPMAEQPQRTKEEPFSSSISIVVP